MNANYTKLFKENGVAKFEVVKLETIHLRVIPHGDMQLFMVSESVRRTRREYVRALSVSLSCVYPKVARGLERGCDC